MRRQTRYTLLAAAVVVLALVVVVYLRAKAPPEAARLLPESDAIVYLNLKPLRSATHFDRASVTRSASYQHFVDATGIVPERDLDNAAFALHRMADPHGPNGPVAYSEVFSGRFNAGRLSRYLAGIANSTEDYAGRTIYALPLDGRTLRVAVLGYDMVAASNMPTTEQIHSILDRQRAGASPFAGSSLLGDRYKDVPAFASAWAVGHIGLPFSEEGQIGAFGLKLPLPADTTFVASLRYEGALHLRIEEIAASEADAKQSAEALNRLLTLLRAIQKAQSPEPRPQPGTDENRAVQQLLDSLTIEQKRDRATLTATIPAEVLHRLSAR